MSCKEATHANINSFMIKSSQRETLLGINLDIQLKFEDDVNFIWKESSQKLYGLARIAAFIDLKQWRFIMKVFSKSRVGCCSLMWRFPSRGPNNNANCIREKVLRIKDKSLIFLGLLENNNSVSIH